MRLWILSGTRENWFTAIEERVWGVRPTWRYLWDGVSDGDVVAFYVLKPVSGIVGFGRAQNKREDRSLLWPDEIEKNQAIYPYRFEIAIEYCLEAESWEKNKVYVQDLHVEHFKGINSLNRLEAISTILSRANSQWNRDLTHLLPREAKPVVERVKKQPRLHDKIRDMLIEIGRIEGKIPEKEYPMDSQRMNVIWKRVATGNPAYAFEIQVGGDIYHALYKLKHAFDIWNSDPFIVVKEQDRPRVKQLVAGGFHEISDRLRTVTVDQVQSLYDLLLEHKRLKESMRLY